MAKLFSHTLTCLLAALALSKDGVALDWTIQNPRLFGPRLNAVASSPSRCVAVGLEGQIVTSVDAVTWSAQPIATNRHLMDVIYRNGMFVAVGALHNLSGAHSLALTSVDGVRWTEQPTDSRPWKSIAFGNGTFVAVGDHTIDTSSDGLAWTRRVPHAYVDFHGVAFGNGTFVAMGVFHDGHGSYFYSVQRSVDGVTWVGETAPAATVLRCIAFGNGLFVMAGDAGVVFTSADGLTWTQQNVRTFATLRDVAFLDGAFLAVGDSGTVIRSANGSDWNYGRGAGAVTLNGCGAAFGRAVAVGDRSSIITSVDHQAWASATSTVDSDLRAVTFANSRFVAVGENAAGAYSNDGETWVARPVFDTIGGSPSTWFNAVTFGASTFVTVGGQGAPTFTSPDATLWTQRYWNLGSDDLFAVAYGAGRFVAVGFLSTGFGMRAGFRTSENGIDWTGGYAGPPSPLYCITHGNALWVAGGESLVTSTDGSNWTARVLPIAGTLYAAAFGAGRFVLAGTVGGVITSTDGVQWTHHPAFDADEIRGLAFDGSQFVAVGKRGSEGVIWTSGDGLNWTLSASAPLPLKGVSAGNGSFVAVGDGGLILQSAGAVLAQLVITRRDASSVEITCQVEAGRACRLQASNDGRNWQDIMSFTASGSGDKYLDSVRPQSARLYRLVSP